MDFKLENARQPLALTLPMAIRHAPLASVARSWPKEQRPVPENCKPPRLGRCTWVT